MQVEGELKFRRRVETVFTDMVDTFFADGEPCKLSPEMFTRKLVFMVLHEYNHHYPDNNYDFFEFKDMLMEYLEPKAMAVWNKYCKNKR